MQLKVENEKSSLPIKAPVVFEMFPFCLLFKVRFASEHGSEHVQYIPGRSNNHPTGLLNLYERNKFSFKHAMEPVIRIPHKCHNLFS